MKDKCLKDEQQIDSEKIGKIKERQKEERNRKRRKQKENETEIGEVNKREDIREDCCRELEINHH